MKRIGVAIADTYNPAAASRCKGLRRPRAHGSVVFDELAIQETASLHPIATNSALGDIQRLGRFLLGHSAKEPTFDDTRETFIDRREMIERLVNLDERLGPIIRDRESVVQRDVTIRTAALLGRAPSRAVDGLARSRRRHPTRSTTQNPTGMRT